MKPFFAACMVFFATVDVTMRAGEPPRTPTFDVALVPTTQYTHGDVYYRTPPGRGPQFSTTRELAPGQRLDLLVLAQGFAVDAEGRAHVTYELNVHYPNGAVQRVPEPVVIIEKKKIDPRALPFPTGIPRFNTNAGDPAGEHRFEVVVRDHVSGGSVTKSAAVQVSASAHPLPLPDGFDPNRFLSGYYLRPQPRLALPALTAFSRMPVTQKKADAHGPLLGFYGRVLNDNPWLVPQFAARLATTTDAAERRLLALVLSYAQRDDLKFAENLPREARAALADARREITLRPAQEPTHGGQLDLEWGEFLASGSFASVSHLVTIAAAYLPHRGKLEEYRRLAAKPKSTPPEVIKDAILGAALWSLGSNARQHKLVHDYLLGIQQDPAATDTTKAVVAEALAWKPAATPAAPAQEKP